MIFQDPMTSLNPVLTIGLQIREALVAHFGLNKAAADSARRRAPRSGRDPEPEARLGDYPHQFSGGMRQRAMIAMALACEPKLLIADEPTTALDVTIQAQILDLLRSLVAERDTALILITHDLGVVAGMCERVNVMYAGTFVETGGADADLRASPSPVHARAAPERAPSRRRAPAEARADSRAAAQHAERAGLVPVRPALPLPVGALHGRAAAARGARARPRGRLLQPGRHRRGRGGPRWAARHDRPRGAPGSSAARRGRRRPGLVPDQERHRARPARRRRQGGRRRHVLDRARRDARARRRVRLRQVDARARDPPPLRADRAAGSRSTERTSRTSRSRGFGPSAGGCRWSSRIRSRRSTRATRSAASWASRCTCTASGVTARRPGCVSCSTSSAFPPTPPRGIRTSSPAGSASGSASPARSR